MIIDDACRVQASIKTSLPAPEKSAAGRIQQDPAHWLSALQKVLDALGKQIDFSQIRALSIDGTSGTVLVVDEKGNPLAPALMYNDSSCLDEATRIKSIAPKDSPANGASSGLAKAMYLLNEFPHAHHLVHQADWLAGQLHGHFNLSDENNALKTGYEPDQESWPLWFNELDININKLPKVFAAGTGLENIASPAIQRFGFSPTCRVVAGTTDSIAAFISTGASHPGEAVSSLGSTLAIKMLSEQAIYSSEYGIYSHKLFGQWLVGGASNCGGKVFLNWFTEQEMRELEDRLDPARLTGLHYYPLATKGERFPRNDPQMQALIEPIPEDRVEFFQALLEGVAYVEKEAYEKLAGLGVSYPNRVITVGGGAKNEAWRKIRQAILGVQVENQQETDAALGCALLAKRSVTGS